MDPQIYELRMRIQSLSDQAVRMTIPDGINPTTMRNWIHRVAAEVRILITIRRVPGGLLCGRSTDEARPHATAVTQRMQTAHNQSQ
jgi:hypothetical protein